VDVTNYVMLLTGQPLHAFDSAKVSGALRVRRALQGETLTTLDDVERHLDTDDVVIADDSGAVALAGTMGGASTEVDGTTTGILLEAAHFDSVAIARQSRRHKLSSEASKRFERGTDPQLPAAAAAVAIALLVEHGGATLASVSEVDQRTATAAIAFDLQRPARTAGIDIADSFVIDALTSVGCVVEGSQAVVAVTPPSWRPDLTDPADLDEEVIRLFGYDNVPSRLPRLPSGRGLTAAQRIRRTIAQTLANSGHIEVLAYPFVGTSELDDLLVSADDERRHLVELANPISDEQSYMRTTMLPGLLQILKRNLGRGNDDNMLFEVGATYRWPAGHQLARGADVVRPSVTSRPSADEQSALQASLPIQQRHLAIVMTGQRERSGWWGKGRVATWEDAIQSARMVAQAAKVDLDVSAGQQAPWHPGRCAQLSLADGTVVGFAGELHPRVCETLGIPARTCAVELDLDAVVSAHVAITRAPAVSGFPVAKEDIALVVDDSVSSAVLENTLREAAGPLLESIRLFDVYRGPQIGADKQSLAFALRFRASDRTLSDGEVAQARQAAVEAAASAHGAVLRS
jgi:phenylalanyl-tRNA synthetase beta chain